MLIKLIVLLMGKLITNYGTRENMLFKVDELKDLLNTTKEKLLGCCETIVWQNNESFITDKQLFRLFTEGFYTLELDEVEHKMALYDELLEFVDNDIEVHDNELTKYCLDIDIESYEEVLKLIYYIIDLYEIKLSTKIQEKYFIKILLDEVISILIFLKHIDLINKINESIFLNIQEEHIIEFFKYKLELFLSLPSYDDEGIEDYDEEYTYDLLEEQRYYSAIASTQTEVSTAITNKAQEYYDKKKQKMLEQIEQLRAKYSFLQNQN